MAKKSGNLLGAWAFLVGVILAIVFAFVPMTTPIAITLFALGVLIGLLNIMDKEIQPFLLAAVALVIVSAFGGSALASVTYAPELLGNMLLLFVPATIIVALRSVFAIAKK